MLKFRQFAILVVFGLGAVGCAGDEEPLSWDEFYSKVAIEPVTGTYIYDGDQTALDLAELRMAFDEYRADVEAEGSTIGSREQPLIVNVYNRKIDKWANPHSITYCVSSASFGARYDEVVSLVAEALDAWKANGAGGNFTYTHLADQDANCTNANLNVTFNVRQDSSTQYYAKAFFPYYPRSSKEVVISSISYDPANLGPWTLGGILKHELGHTLGFRHEHIRPENKNRNPATCSKEDRNWSALTVYDSNSVMHYPHNGCAGTNTGDLDITALDTQGAHALYP